MIYVIGDDPDGEDRLEQLKQGLGAPELQQLNTSIFDGQKVSMDDLVAACEAMPFLAEHRLVVLRGLLSRFQTKDGAGDKGNGAEGSAERKVPELVRQLKDYLPRVPADAVLVLIEPAAITKQNPLHKTLVAAEATFAQTGSMRPDELAEWIERRVAQKGGRTASGASRMLASVAGNNLRALDQEIDKLVAYAGAGPIDERAIRQLVTAARELNVFKLADAIAEGNLSSALRRLHDLLDEGEHPLPILAMVARQFRMLIQVKELRGSGMRTDEIAARLRLKPFVVQRVERQLGRYPAFEQLENVYRRLLECNAAGKTTGGDVVVSLELLIAELAQAR